MRLLIGLASVAIVASTAGYAQWVSPDFKPQNVPSIKVEINDQSEGGCWTNLAESRASAESQLREKGYEVVVDNSAFSFMVTVLSSRSEESGLCFGSVRVQTYTISYVSNMFGFHEVADWDNVFVGDENANRGVLELVRTIIAEM